MSERTSFCAMPWNGLWVTPQGDYLPCCVYNRQGVPFKTYDEYKNSDELKELKQKLLNGEYPIECEFCWIHEKSESLESLRRQADRLFEFDINDDTPKVLILPTGANSCNLACRTCSSYASTLWMSQEKKATKKGITIEIFPHDKFYKDNTYTSKIKELCKTALDVTFAGGEPFLETGMNEHIELLNTLDPSVEVNYISNGSIYPSKELRTAWERFDKRINISISLDGIKDKHEYLRYPSTWDEILENLAKYKEDSKIGITISHTISMFNILYLGEFLKWCVHEKLCMPPFFGLVTYPDEYSIRHLPNDVKGKLIARYDTNKHFKHVVGLLKMERNDQHYRNFLKSVDVYDEIRQQKFMDIFPEMYELITKNPD